MLRRVLALLAALVLFGAATAEGPYCVVEGSVALLADASGRALTDPGAYRDLFPVRPGSLYAAGDPGDYALLDASGRVLSDERFDMIDDAGDALVFRRGQRYGAMDAQGRVILEPVWTQLTPDGAGGWLALADSAVDEIPDALVHIGADGGAVETDALVLGRLRAVREDRMACAGPDGRFFYVDGTGAQAFPGTWRAAGDFAGGRAIVTGDGGSGVIDREGRAVIEPVYRFLAELEDAYAAVDADGGLIVFDRDSGAARLTLSGGPLDVRVAGTALAVSDERETKLMSTDGRVLCRASAAAVFEAGEGGQFIATDGAMDGEVSWLVNPDGSRASGDFRRLLPLCADRYAWMTLSGTAYHSDALDDAATAWDYRSLRWGLMDGGGRTLLPARYRSIRALDDERLLLVTDDAVALANRNGRALHVWFSDEASSGE